MIRLSTIVLALLALTGTTNADSWRIVPGQSSLAFTYEQDDTAFTGRFERFTADITYDPAHPEDAHVRAEIDLLSARTGADDRDSALQTPTWFDTGAFPKAVFEATGFTPLGDNRFTADGTLTLKGVTQPLTLHFTLDIDGDTAHAAGKTKIVRTNFNVGSGDFESGKWISKAVTVELTLTANCAGDAP